MITVSLRGQMCNQAFIVATAIAHALKNNTDYRFPRTSGKRNQFPFMFPWLPLEKGETISTVLYREKQFGVYNEISPPPFDNLHLQGYFQSEKYFKDYRKEVLEALCFPKWDIRRNTVAIHIRRGDYLRLSHKHNVATVEWVRKAMDQFDFGYRFIFFSDDIEWCMYHFNQDNRCSFSFDSNLLVAIGNISSCEHGIISASTFGWWGNWIAENNGKGERKVIAPKNWFAEGYTKLRSDDIVPENWIKI